MHTKYRQRPLTLPAALPSLTIPILVPPSSLRASLTIFILSRLWIRTHWASTCFHNHLPLSGPGQGTSPGAGCTIGCHKKPILRVAVYIHIKAESKRIGNFQAFDFCGHPFLKTQRKSENIQRKISVEFVLATASHLTQLSI